MEDNEKKVIQISLNKFIILVILLIVVLGLGIGLYVNALKKSNTESEMQSMNEKENSVNEIKISSDENIAFGIRYNKDFEDMLVEYILSSIREYAKNGSILKSTTGDITAEQLTVEEVNSNNSKYKEKIIEMLTDKEIFKDIYKVDNKDACKYNFEKILNNLGLGTHMGIGTGKTDESGNKVYVYGMTQIDTTTQSSGN